MSKISDGLNYIIQAISNMLEDKVNYLDYDKTYRAKVLEKLDNNLYKIQIKGVEYNLNYNGNLNVGDIVKAKAPLNNFSDVYIETVTTKEDNNPVGSILLYAGNEIPSGYLVCNGASLLTTDYPNLFNVIGYTYGTEDEQHFNLPDLSERVPVGKSNNEPYNVLGNKGGEKAHVMTIEEMPNHNHPTSTTQNLYSMNDPTNKYTRSGIQDTGNPGVYWSSAVASQGGGQPFNIEQPYLIINYIIKY